ncbi:hypothetical protein VTN77DRAFT_4754 [Rasamsonia byssochlamydoides]|uniref:uncharacterized protein n=1 Tax=Rasamsonia byssochlamydoides TaxID=89139 RepID=UPI003743DEF9
MPAYLDFLSVFGLHKMPRELRFSGFREQSALSDPPAGPAAPSLGRSGRQYQLCFNLKGVARISDAKSSPREQVWSIRQAAFHHQFDVLTGTTLWIIVKGNLQLKDLTGKDGRREDRAFDRVEECFRSSLAIHLLNCHWSTEEWRWYLQWLEEVVDLDTENATVLCPGYEASSAEYTPQHLLTVQNYEEKTNEAIMVMQANAEVLASLSRFYEDLLEDANFPLAAACQKDIHHFAAQVNDMIQDSKMQITRANLLVRITSDRKSLITQHLQSQATIEMAALTRSMHKMGSMSQKEAIAMRIITVVTLIYLPATFVSTFFSTDVIKYQTQNDSDASSQSSASAANTSFQGSYSGIAMARWLEVTLPLTAITLVAAFASFKLADRERKREFLFLRPTEVPINLA